VLLTITTTHRPATDLGYLLVKHPDRVQEFRVSTGTAYVCYPQAGPDRCTAALLLDIDPLALRSKGRDRPEDFTLGRFVNDRPYAASSLLSAAIAQVFGSARRGTSTDRPELAATPIPLELRLPAVRCRGGGPLAESLFAPLGWTVTTAPLEDSPSHVDLTLTGTLRLADALNHVYVLLPVLDDAKHYWVAADEVDKLLRAGTGWLAAHPQRALIARRYLAHRRALATVALARLAETDSDPEAAATTATADEDAELPPAARTEPLALQRRTAVRAALSQTEDLVSFAFLVCALLFARSGLYAGRAQRPGLTRIVAGLFQTTVVALLFALVNGLDFSSYYIFYGSLFFSVAYVGLFRYAYESTTGAVLKAAGYRRRAILVGTGEHIDAVAHALTRGGDSPVNIMGSRKSHRNPMLLRP